MTSFGQLGKEAHTVWASQGAEPGPAASLTCLPPVLTSHPEMDAVISPEVQGAGVGGGGWEATSSRSHGRGRAAPYHPPGSGELQNPFSVYHTAKPTDRRPSGEIEKENS